MLWDGRKRHTAKIIIVTLFEKKKIGKKKERSILFYSHYLVDLLISFFREIK